MNNYQRSRCRPDNRRTRTPAAKAELMATAEQPLVDASRSSPSEATVECGAPKSNEFSVFLEKLVSLPNRREHSGWNAPIVKMWAWPVGAQRTCRTTHGEYGPISAWCNSYGQWAVSGRVVNQDAAAHSYRLEFIFGAGTAGGVAVTGATGAQSIVAGGSAQLECDGNTDTIRNNFRALEHGTIRVYEDK
jgi:hypothetical protein